MKKNEILFWNKEGIQKSKELIFKSWDFLKIKFGQNYKNQIRTPGNQKSPGVQYFII